jgi:hypothetical protein
MSFGDPKIDKDYDDYKLSNREDECRFVKNCRECGCDLPIDNASDYEAISFCEECHAEKVQEILYEIENKVEEDIWIEAKRKMDGSRLGSVQVKKY